MVRRLLTSIPDFALAGVFLVTWLWPYALGEDSVRYCMLTMLLEFIIIHSSAFMGAVVFSQGSKSRRMLGIFGFALFYLLFVTGFAIGFQTWWPIVAFLGLTLNRSLGILTGDAPQGREKQYIQAGWALSVLYYLGGVCSTMLLPVPALGITAEVRRGLDLPGSGEWVNEPQRVVAFGVIYFSLTAIGEILGWARNERFLQGVPAEKA